MKQSANNFRKNYTHSIDDTETVCTIHPSDTRNTTHEQGDETMTNAPTLDCLADTLEQHNDSWRVKRTGTSSLQAGFGNFVKNGDLVIVGDQLFKVDGEGRQWKEGREYVRYVYLELCGE